MSAAFAVERFVPAGHAVSRCVFSSMYDENVKHFVPAGRAGGLGYR